MGKKKKNKETAKWGRKKIRLYQIGGGPREDSKKCGGVLKFCA
jgi:hypothetical protein